jgi:choline dehydrogenase
VAEPGRDWDYIVVGAGSAGCVLAGRLSEQPDRRVLLIEAGGSDRSLLIRIPGMVERVIQDRRYNWHYAGRPDRTLGGRSLDWAAGKVLGGGSSINGMVFVRGLRSDFDRWEPAGHAGWNWSGLLPYFRRMEQWHGAPSASRGSAGPLHVAEFRQPNAACLAWRDAAVAAGVPSVADYNEGIDMGTGITQATQFLGRRHSANDAFLQPAVRRPNLSIVSDAVAARLLVRNGRCHGLEYWRRGQLLRHEALREIVVACGAIGSPALLLRSGIGAPDQLRAAGIRVCHPLPGVGRNLQEHVNVRLTARMTTKTYSNAARGVNRGLNGLRWLLRGDGPASSPAGHVQTFLKTEPGPRAADIQVQALPLSFDLDPTDRSEAMTLVVSLCRPAARGAVRLAGAAPEIPPEIDIDLLPDADARALIRGCRRVREIVAAAGPTFRGEAIPGPGVRTEAEWLGFIRGIAGLNWHPSGTCRMGDGPMDVVGFDLRVHGLEGLSVADASIMPFVTSGNTNAPVIAVAEKAGDLIRARNG